MNTAVVGGRLVEIIPYDARPHQENLSALVRQRLATGTGPQYFVPIWHRRSGKSTSLVNTLFEHASNPKLKGQFYYFYPEQKKIREHIWDNSEIVRKYLPMSQVAKVDEQRMVIHFKTGSQVIFDGTDENPDKHRGGNGLMYVVDEGDDQKEKIFTDIIRPIIEFNKGVVILCGTPRGVRQLHKWYAAGQDTSRPQWWSQLLPATESTDANGVRLFSDEQLALIENDYKADGIGDTFKQEYLCSFLAGASQVFRKLDQVIVDEFGLPLQVQEPIDSHRYRIGVDPALTTDYWVNSVWDMHTHHEVFIERFQPQDTSLGEARTEAICRKWGMAELLLDESGLGKPISDHLIQKGLPITPIKTGVMKERLITNLSILIDNLQVRLLPDPVAMAEMRDFTFERLPGIVPRYRFTAPEGKHDDTVLARALAVWEIGEQIPLPKTGWNPFEKPQEPDSSSPNSFYGKFHNKSTEQI
jgi:hypothetical protein